jgi:hypothetical protein
MKKTLAVLALCLLLCTGCVDEELDIAEVSAPAINCVFDSDCTVMATDSSDDLLLEGMVGSGFLQSRTLPVGEPGTPGEGLYSYEYRIDLREQAGITHISCVTTFSLDFGPVAALDYDGDGETDQVYVVTGGGLGNVAPTQVERSGNTLTFYFSPGVCAGSAPGNGDSSFFFGLASAHPAQYVTAEVKDSEGHNYSLEARAPDFP